MRKDEVEEEEDLPNTPAMYQTVLRKNPLLLHKGNFGLPYPNSALLPPGKNPKDGNFRPRHDSNPGRGERLSIELQKDVKSSGIIKSRDTSQNFNSPEFHTTTHKINGEETKHDDSSPYDNLAMSSMKTGENLHNTKDMQIYNSVKSEIKENYLMSVVSSPLIKSKYIEALENIPATVTSEQYTNIAKGIKEEANNYPKIGTNLDKKTIMLRFEEVLAQVTITPIPEPTFKINSLYIKFRPFVVEFLIDMSEIYELIVVTQYKESEINVAIEYLEEKGISFSYKIFKKHFIRGGNKELIQIYSMLLKNRTWDNTIIIETNPYSYLLNIQNGIPISKFEGKDEDKELARIGKACIEVNNWASVCTFLMRTLTKVLSEELLKNIEDV